MQRTQQLLIAGILAAVSINASAIGSSLTVINNNKSVPYVSALVGGKCQGSLQPFTGVGETTHIPKIIVQALCGSGNTCTADVYSFSDKSCDAKTKTLIGTATLHMDTFTVDPINAVGNYDFKISNANSGPTVALN